MTKIAYNKCFGGFSLSEAGFEALLDRKGIIETSTTPSMYEFCEYRSDPDLIAVLEELGAAADGSYSDLQIRELPAGTRYYIDEYDGTESVVTEAEHDWKIA